MAEIKTNSQKELEEAVIEVGMELVKDFHKGYTNENKIKAADVIIRLYEAVKAQSKK